MEKRWEGNGEATLASHILMLFDEQVLIIQRYLSGCLLRSWGERASLRARLAVRVR